VSPLAVVARILALAIPLGIGWFLAKRAGRRLHLAAACVGLGAAAFAPASLIETALRHFTGAEDAAHGGELVRLVYALLVAAPLEQALKLAAFTPVFRTRSEATPLDGVIYAGATALGFATAHNALYLFARQPEGYGAIIRALADVPAQAFFAAVWGYALGKDPDRRLGGRVFNATWLAATVFNGVFDDIAFERRLSALLATIPILAAIGFMTWFTARDLLVSDRPPLSRPSFARRILPALAPPSIEAMRAALRRSERPVMLRWVVVGALVTIGVMTSALVAAVALGHRLGVDFAAVDRGDLAAPVTVVFALAFAPVAFGLACAGAWMGRTR